MARQRTALPWGFFPYDVSETQVATNIGFTSPDCAAPTGFLCLLTLCSTQARTALFHAESVRGVETLRGFPLPVAATAFTAPCPFSQRRRSEKHRIAPGFMHLEGPFTTGRCYPNPVGRSSLSLLSPSRNFPLSLGSERVQSLLSWAFPQRRTSPSLWPLSKVSKNSRVGESLSRFIALHGVYVQEVFNRGC